MSDSAAVPEDLRTRTRRLLSWQIITGLLVVAGFYLVRGGWAALSAGYGGALSILLALLLSLSVALAGRSETPAQGQWILYAGAGLRFVLILVLFAIGLAVLGLMPLAMVAGFIAVQLVFITAAGTR